MFSSSSGRFKDCDLSIGPVPARSGRRLNKLPVLASPNLCAIAVSTDRRLETDHLAHMYQESRQRIWRQVQIHFRVACPSATQTASLDETRRTSCAERGDNGHGGDSLVDALSWRVFAVTAGTACKSG